MEDDDESSSLNYQKNDNTNNTKIQKFFLDFKAHPLVMLFNLLLTLACIIIYILTTYKPNLILKNEFAFFLFNFLSRIYFLLDFILDICTGIIDFSLKYLSNFLIEIISLLPYFFSRIFIGMNEDLINNTHMITSSFISIRLFNILNYSKFIKSDVNRELFNIMTSIFCLLITSSILINVIENTQTIGKYWLFLERDCNDSYNCNGTNDTFHSSLFYVMTTVAIIGYYSTISSVLGRIIIIVLIILSVIQIPALSSDLMVLLSSKSVYARTVYKILEGVEFILISGNISNGSIVVLLQEYFHPDHGEDERHALILLPQGPDTGMKSLLQEYPNKLFYFEGDPLKLNDLQRCQFRNASMIMLLCNKQTDDSAAEDSKTIIQAMAIKKHFNMEDENKKKDGTFNGSITNFYLSRTFAFDNNDNNGKQTEEIPILDNSNFINSDNSDKDKKINYNNINDKRNDKFKNINNNKVLNNNNNIYNNVKKNEKIESSLIIQLLRPESEHHFALSISKNNNTDQIVCIDELKLSLLAKSCLCRGIIALISNLIITNNFEEGIEKQLGNSKWIEEYKHGKDYEIYKIPLEYLRGYKFSVIAEKIYNEKKTILFGLNLESKSDNSNLVLLSPMDFIIPLKRDINVFGYLLAKDQNDADSITTWEKTQKRIEISNVNNIQFNNKKYLNKNIELEEGEIDMKNNLKNNDIYSTDILSLAKICHITTEHISKTSVTIDSIDKMLIAKEHIIICGVCQNLIDFIKPLRSKNLPKRIVPTIVILSKELPDDKIWNTISFFEQIYLVQGDPMKRSDLKRAGIKSAKKVVILAPGINEISQFTLNKKLKNLKINNEDDENNEIKQVITARKLTREEEDLLDAKTIFKYNMISKINKDIFCVIELINPSNVSFLNNKKRKNNDEYLFLKAGLNIDATASFAAGEVYYSSIMDNVITQAYYNPSLLNVLKKLIVGEDQSNIINKNILKRYSNITSGNLYLINMPIGIFPKNLLIYNKIKFEDVFKFFIQMKIIVIGIYRAEEINSLSNFSSDNKNSFNKDKKLNDIFYYVVTAPDENFEVSSIDRLFVISPEFPDIDSLNNYDINNKDDDYISSDDLVGNFKVHNKKIEEKKENRREIDEEGEEKLKCFNEELKETKSLLDDIQSCIYKVQNDSEKIIANSIKKKLNNIIKKGK